MSEIAPFIQSELTKFNKIITEDGLKSLAAKYQGLQISSVEDKDGYNAVYEARQALKKKRVEIEKIGKEMRSSATEFNKAVIARENELVAIIEPTEKLLLAEETRIDTERERIKKEEEEKENQRINSMISKLAALNYAVDVSQLKNLNDESFAELLTEATKEFNASEEKRKQKEAEDREAKRQKEEQLEAERLKLKKEQEELAEQRRKIQKEQDRLKKEQEEKDAEARRKFEAEQEEFRKEQARIKSENDAREAAIKAEQEKLETEKRAIQEAKEAEERERLRLIQEEEERVASEERAKADEAERVKKIEEEEEQKRLFAIDQELFRVVGEKIAIIHAVGATNILSAQSVRGINAAKRVIQLLDEAFDVCNQNMQ